jgi:hypothetical protein
MHDMDNLAEFVQEFRRDRFTQVPDSIAQSDIILLKTLMSKLVVGAETVTVTHKLKSSGEGITGGSNYLRFDGGHPTADSAVALRQNELLTTSGLSEFGSGLAANLHSLVENVLDSRVSYERCYFLAYRPGHYISAHDDRQTGNRINVQIPIPVDCRSCIRTLDQRTGLMVNHEDIAGQLRFLGPGVWHDVPPFVGYDAAIRYVFTLRYRYVG